MSLISILASSAVFRHLYGKKAQPLFYPSIKEIANKTRFENPTLDTLAWLILSFTLRAFGLFLFTLALAPFLNIVKFTHDAVVIYMVISICFLITTAPTMIKNLTASAKNYFMALKEKSWKKIIAPFKTLIFTSLGFVILLLIQKVFPKNAFNSLKGVIDPEPFNLKSYFSNIIGESGIDLTLLSLSIYLLFITSGKSLRPIAQFVAMGCLIVLIGWASGIAIDMSIPPPNQ